MNRTPVASTTINSVGYDQQRQILEVQFQRGGTYQYLGVPESVYQGLMAAGSKGSYLETFVKKAGYRHQRVG